MFGSSYHELEAFESYDRACDEGYRYYKKHQNMEGDFGPNPNYYHSWIPFDSIKAESEKSYLIHYAGMDLWVAKKLIKGFNNIKTEMLVHTATFTKIVENETNKIKQEFNESKEMTVICPYCQNKAELAWGYQVYPHRDDLKNLKFWLCKPCDAWVGTHKPSTQLGHKGYEPLGRLANKELRRAKSQAHAYFDPLWKNGQMTRAQAYDWLANQMGITGKDCHIGMFDVDECNTVVSIVKMFKK